MTISTYKASTSLSLHVEIFGVANVIWQVAKFDIVNENFPKSPNGFYTFEVDDILHMIVQGFFFAMNFDALRIVTISYLISSASPYTQTPFAILTF